jgi:hypothetical protein
MIASGLGVSFPPKRVVLPDKLALELFVWELWLYGHDHRKNPEPGAGFSV